MQRIEERWMNTISRSVATARRDMTSLSEEWKTLHEEAMASQQWENLLQRGVVCFRSIFHADENYRRLLATGDQEYQEAGDVLLFCLFRLWCDLSERMEREVQRVEIDGYSVDHANEFRTCREEALKVQNAIGELAESHPVAFQELATLTTQLEDSMLQTIDAIPAETQSVAALLLALRQRNLTERGMSEAEIVESSNLTDYPGSLLGELVDRRYRLWPTVTEFAWEKR